MGKKGTRCKSRKGKNPGPEEQGKSGASGRALGQRQEAGGARLESRCHESVGRRSPALGSPDGELRGGDCDARAPGAPRGAQGAHARTRGPSDGECRQEAEE